ncbi:MAG: hypothetical protein ACE5LQ_01245 [Candidatus Bipolaricaulia bacterium]
MEEERRKLTRLAVLVGVLVLLLAGLLTLVAGEFVREHLIRPLLFLFQLIGIYLRAIPQLGIWFFLLLLLVLISAYFLRDLRRAAARPKEERREEEPPPPGPVVDLAKRIELGADGEYFRWRIRRELRDLLVELLAWQRGISKEEALELVRSGAWTDDPRMRELFRRGFDRRYTLLAQLQEFFSSLLGRRDEGFVQELATVVNYLEGFASGKANLQVPKSQVHRSKE